MKRNRILEAILVFLPLIILLTGWQLIGSSSLRMTFLYATPTSVISTLFGELATAEFWGHIAVTFGEVFGGLVLGNCLGTVFAMLLWFYPLLGKVSRPYIVALASIPIFAIMPLFILWFGVGFVGKLAIIIFSTAFVALAYCLAAAMSFGKNYDEVIASMGGSRIDLLKKVVIPGVIARGFVAYRINVSFALIGAYIAEWVSAKRGLGQYILRATTLYDVPRVWAGLIVFLSLAFFLYASTSWIERKVVPAPERP